MEKQQEEFWVTNISKMNVSLADLNLTIKSFHSVNLMDTRHYSYTPDQLKKSAESGSLFTKNKFLSVRKVAPKIKSANMAVIRTLYDKESKSWSEDGIYIPNRARSVLKVNDVIYEELEVGQEIIDQKTADEKFALENIELVNLDEESRKHKG